jgi:hypothetical protein
VCLAHYKRGKAKCSVHRQRCTETPESLHSITVQCALSLRNIHSGTCGVCKGSWFLKDRNGCHCLCRSPSYDDQFPKIRNRNLKQKYLSGFLNFITYRTFLQDCLQKILLSGRNFKTMAKYLYCFRAPQAQDSLIADIPWKKYAL